MTIAENHYLGQTGDYTDIRHCVAGFNVTVVLKTMSIKCLNIDVLECLIECDINQMFIKHICESNVI